jgi:hypothetical protein
LSLGAWTASRVARCGPVILVGHSLGGVTITGVGNMAHELLEDGRLVYLTASCCVELPSLSCYWETHEAQSSLLNNIPTVGDSTSTGATRVNWRSADPEFLQKVRRAQRGRPSPGIQLLRVSAIADILIP